jgi:hypothetical protein
MSFRLSRQETAREAFGGRLLEVVGDAAPGGHV